jgi:hypothetical protein
MLTLDVATVAVAVPNSAMSVESNGKLVAVNNGMSIVFSPVLTRSSIASGYLSRE